MQEIELRPWGQSANSARLIASVGVHVTSTLHTAGRLSRAALVVVAIGLSACGSAPIRGSATLLDFLKEDATTREQVIVELGDPTAAYDGSKIMTYRLNRDDGGYYLVRNLSLGWANAPFSLVLVFDDKGLLRTRSIVAVK